MSPKKSLQACSKVEPWDSMMIFSDSPARPRRADSSREMRLLAALVFKRAGIKMEQIIQGEITEDQFEALIDAVGTVIASSLVVE